MCVRVGTCVHVCKGGYMCVCACMDMGVCVCACMDMGVCVCDGEDPSLRCSHIVCWFQLH